MNQNTTHPSPYSILVVDDEQVFLNSVQRKLRLEGYVNVAAFTDPLQAAASLTGQRYDVALLDITMPGMDGLKLLELIKKTSPQTECVMITANQDIPLVVRAMKLGAYDYLVKPIQPSQLVHALNRALERRRMLEVIQLRRPGSVDDAPDIPPAFAAMVTANDAMLAVIREAQLHARSDLPVLITGETGTGKELLARAVHNASPRAGGPFMAVNMLSLSPSLFESEFFGHIKGAFTGAIRDKKGYLDQAGGGTLFLDEIGDLPLEIQGKLLRILQEGEYVPVGKTRAEKSDCRIVAATNLDLEAQVEAGAFRRDLYYRLRFACLSLPPLRERMDDIRLLAAHILRHSPQPPGGLSQAAVERLLGHDWPGNIRELKGVLEAAANLAQSGEVQPEHLNLPAVAMPAVAAGHAGPLLPLAEIERQYILDVYTALERNKTHAAKALGVSLATLHRKLKAYGVS
jgi:two-component system response regulator AtoC